MRYENSLSTHFLTTVAVLSIVMGSAAMCCAQTLELVGPEKPVQPGGWAVVTVESNGIDPNEVSFTIEPATSKVFLIRRSPTSVVVLFDSTLKSGTYQVLAELNTWLPALRSAVERASAAGVDEPALASLRTEIATWDYPVCSDSCALEVAGENPPRPNPPIPPGPDPPIPPGPEATGAVLLIETASTTQEQNILIQKLRDNLQLSEKVLILDPDLIDENDQQSTWVTKAKQRIGDASLPIVVAFSADGVAVDHKPLPKTIGELVQLLGEWEVKP